MTTVIDSPWIQTISGKKVHFKTPQCDQLELDDIAHGLSHICRFTGHVKSFYSVAQHCVHGALKAASEYKDKELAKWFLLHDASEAYLGDVSSPVKRLLRIYDEDTKQNLSLYDAYEERLAAVIYYRFGLDVEQLPKYQDKITEIDLRMLYTERNQLMKHFNTAEWGDKFEPFKMRLIAWDSKTARTAYLNTYTKLFETA